MSTICRASGWGGGSSGFRGGHVMLARGAGGLLVGAGVVRRVCALFVEVVLGVQEVSFNLFDGEEGRLGMEC